MPATLIDKDRRAANRAFVGELGAHFDDFGIYPVETAALDAVEPSIADLRRARRRREDVQGVGYMSLVEADGVLRWELGAGPAPSRRGGPRRWARDTPAPGQTLRVLRQYKFADLPPNEVGAKLQQLDERLTRTQGLFQVVGGAPPRVGRREAKPVEKGRILLFVHGTFSHCDNLLAEIAATPDGRRLLDVALAGGRYAQVLAFNHPTLSVSPLLNAAELARRFRDSRAEVDVICHSRGGLVARWWLEALDHAAAPRGTVVFAGAPLAGTSLAAPPRLRAALNLLTNLSRALRLAAQTTGRVFPAALPIGEAAGVLFGLFGKLTALAAKTPIVDAGVAMIPGLAGQSREGANRELLELRGAFDGSGAGGRARRAAERYAFLTSNFEPEDPAWRFWRYFRKDQMLNTAADLVFDGPNDLVVDTASMTGLADSFVPAGIPPDRIERFGDASAVVHHLNYFQQPETIRFITRSLGLA